MKILHIVHTPRHSGAERLVASLCEIHRQGGHACEVISLNESEDNFLEVIEGQARIGVRWVQLPTRLNKVLKIVKLRQYFKRYNADLILAHSVIPAAYARLTAVPDVIPVLHATDDYQFRDLARLECALQYRAKSVVSVSQASADNYKFRYRRPKSVTIPNGINIEDFVRPTSLEKIDFLRCKIRAELGISADCKIIVQIGRVDTIKRQDSTIRAAAQQINKDPTIHLVFAGILEDKKYIEQLGVLVRDLGLGNNIHFTGARADIANLLHAADVFAMPSRIESQGIALLEALASEIPVVASRITAFEFAKFMPSVQLIDPSDVGLFSSALRAALNEENFAQRDISAFDIRTCAQRYLDLAGPQGPLHA